MACFSCGKTFGWEINSLLAICKKQYEKQGIERYFYRTSSTSKIKICRSSEFKFIFEKQIKPNFDNGAEYAHIKEYNP